MAKKEWSITLANEKTVLGDFDKQGKAFNKAIKKSMQVIGKQMKKTQKMVLKRSVIQWTGNLANSVTSRVKAKEVRVGADLGKANYGDFIEAGGRGGFMGYWYMSASMYMNQGFIKNRLKQDMNTHHPK